MTATDVSLLVEFIVDRLEEDDILVDKDVVEHILDLELEYMIENNLAYEEE